MLWIYLDGHYWPHKYLENLTLRQSLKFGTSNAARKIGLYGEVHNVLTSIDSSTVSRVNSAQGCSIAASNFACWSLQSLLPTELPFPLPSFLPGALSCHINNFLNGFCYFLLCCRFIICDLLMRSLPPCLQELKLSRS